MDVNENASNLFQTYGAEEDKTLGIENEDATNVIAARKFVGWYNGLPCDKDLKVRSTATPGIICIKHNAN